MLCPTPKRVSHRAPVAHVTRDEFHVGVEIIGPLRLRPVHLWIEIVQDQHTVPARQQFIREV
jgi:hypothetical protein